MQERGLPHRRLMHSHVHGVQEVLHEVRHEQEERNLLPDHSTGVRTMLPQYRSGLHSLVHVIAVI
jgi:hypothetical protein